GVCRTPWWNQADSAARDAFERTAALFLEAGAQVSTLELDSAFARLNEAQITLSAYEFYRALTHERTQHPELISASLTGRIAAGGAVTRAQYEQAHADTRRGKALIAASFSEFDILLAPSTPGEAPDIASTGEPTFGLMWTLLGLPCLTLPCGFGPFRLPLGAQLVAASADDRTLLRCASWAQQVLSGR
ncbi:MAG: hypothetical protein H7125_17760, partial [Proteobacteria bacterium]|nr:hypothetical protein [Burkholderiales bacterium]